MKNSTKKKPLRTCIVCREEKGKTDLIRIVKTANGEIMTDLTGKANGRGAYICKSGVCVDKARKERRLEKALKCAIDAGVYDRLEEFSHKQ
jgi:predicted RNA-binding protein YlxR (DUF448 family)